MKTKIYLAKSNRSNPDDVSRVRQVLFKYKDDFEVVEYNGGGYTHKDLLKCDILLIVPDLSSFKEGDNYVELGKGLHEQISAFENHVTNNSDILFVTKTNKNYIDVAQFEELDLADCDDYINYSTAIISKETDSLESILVNRFGCDEYIDESISSSSDIDLMYLLIKRKK